MGSNPFPLRHTLYIRHTSVFPVAPFASRVRKPRGAVRYAKPFGHPSPAASLFPEMRRTGIDPTRLPEDAMMDCVTSRLSENPKSRPK